MMPCVGPHAPSFGGQLWGAAKPFAVSLTTGGISETSLQYDCLTHVAWVAVPFCLAGDPLLGCVPACQSLVASMALGDICHGP